jgi:DNA-binding NarL/FixJ family response regulator
VELLRLGLGNKAIADRLGISHDTARRYSSRVKHKTQVPSVTALPSLSWAGERDWLDQIDFRERQPSEAEMRVLRLLCRGHGSKQIARTLDLSSRTVEKHREHLLRKFQCRSTRQLTAWLASQYAKCGIADSSDES